MIKLTFSREEWTIIAQLLDAEVSAQQRIYEHNKPAMERNRPYIESLDNIHAEISMALSHPDESEEGGAK